MTLRERAALIVCVLLHSYVLWNVYQADKLTPRVVSCLRHGHVHLTYVKAEEGISPWENANLAPFTEPAILIWTDSDTSPPDVESEASFVWVPTHPNMHPVVCFQHGTVRLAQCIYRTDMGGVDVVTTLLRGDHI